MLTDTLPTLHSTKPLPSQPISSRCQGDGLSPWKVWIDFYFYPGILGIRGRLRWQRETRTRMIIKNLSNTRLPMSAEEKQQQKKKKRLFHHKYIYLAAPANSRICFLLLSPNFTLSSPEHINCVWATVAVFFPQGLHSSYINQGSTWFNRGHSCPKPSMIAPIPQKHWVVGIAAIEWDINSHLCPQVPIFCFEDKPGISLWHPN